MQRQENLWIKMIRDYWSDPRNVLGEPGSLVRRLFKAIWLGLSIYVLFYVAGPSQVASWQLWMEDDALAARIAWGFTIAAALCFAIVGYAAEATSPVRVPIPFLEFEGSIKNVRVHTTHLHIPNVRVAMGSLVAIGLFLLALIGQWNYYLHDNLTTSGASVAAIDGSANRVAEAEAALREHQEATRSALAGIDAAIAATPANSPTGRSRLVRQRTELMTSAATETARLRDELRVARETTVEVRSTASDPRPVDGQVASALNADRTTVSSLLDLARSGLVEALLMMGAGLGLVGATSRVGVPTPAAKPEDEFVATEPKADAEPADPAPPPPPRRRYVLPTATDEDIAQASAIGPHGSVSRSEPDVEPQDRNAHPGPADDDGGAIPADDPEPQAEPQPEPQAEPQADIDPLVADQLNREPQDA